MPVKNYYVAGQWNVVCQRCGFRFKSGELQQEWTGLRVCSKCYEPRHPQTLIKVPEERSSVPWTSPEPTDLFIYDPEVQTWITQVTTNGGTLTTATKTAVDAFVVSAKASGYWYKIKRLNLFCGDNLAAARTPLKWQIGTAGQDALAGSANFVEADYTEATGLTSTGTQGLSTGITATSLTRDDVHFAIYNRSSSVGGVGPQIGAQAGVSGERCQFSAPTSDGALISRFWDATGFGTLTVASSSSPYGLMVATRTDSVTHSIYQYGSLAGRAYTVAGAEPPPSTITVFGAQGAFSYTGSSVNLAAYSIGAGLTAQQVADYHTHMQTFQTALGRAV